MRFNGTRSPQEYVALENFVHKEKYLDFLLFVIQNTAKSSYSEDEGIQNLLTITSYLL